jgi:hypothetical protein
MEIAAKEQNANLHIFTDVRQVLKGRVSSL